VQVEPPVEPEPAPVPETGTVRITTDVDDGAVLFVNGENRGPLSDGMTLELAPGAYNLEARSGDAQIVSQTVTVTPGQESAVTLSVPAVPDEPVAPEPAAPEPRGPRAQSRDEAGQEARPQQRPARESQPGRTRPSRPAIRPDGLPANPF
jgi:hypothetical protein